MTYLSRYETPLGFSDIILTSDGECLTGLRFENASGTENAEILSVKPELSIFAQTREWLDIYFSGKSPDFTPRYSLNGLTPFRKDVIDIICTLEYGRTMTYGEIAKLLSEKRGLPRMSAQAVGGAVSRNPICIIIPCHRVLGAGGRLIGYNGGLANKTALLAHEGIPYKAP